MSADENQETERVEQVEQVVHSGQESAIVPTPTPAPEPTPTPVPPAPQPNAAAKKDEEVQEKSFFRKKMEDFFAPRTERHYNKKKPKEGPGQSMGEAYSSAAQTSLEIAEDISSAVYGVIHRNVLSPGTDKLSNLGNTKKAPLEQANAAASPTPAPEPILAL